MNYLLNNLTKLPGILVIIGNSDERYLLLSLSSTHNDCFIQIFNDRLSIWKNAGDVSLFNVQVTLKAHYINFNAFLTFVDCEDHSGHK